MTPKRERNLRDKLIVLFVRYRMIGSFVIKYDSEGRLFMDISAREVLKHKPRKKNRL